MGGGLSPAVHAAAYDAGRHDALIHSLRAGNTDWRDALPVLRAWQETVPAGAAQQRLVGDAVVIAWEAGEPTEAVAVIQQAGVAALPDYALAPGVAAARAVGNDDIRAALIQAWLARSSGSWEARIQSVLLQVDQGRHDEAQAAIDTQFPETDPGRAQRVALLEVRGALAEGSADHLAALAIYQALQALAPEHAYARRAPAYLLGRVAAPAAGDAYARHVEERVPGTYTAVERAELSQQALGQSLRWAVQDRDLRVGEGSARLDALRALWPRFAPLQAQVAQGIAQAQAQDDGSLPTWQAIARRLAHDEILALFALGRYQDVIDRYAHLSADGEEPPYYVLSAVAGAHQYLRRSDRAVPLYEAALRAGDGLLPVPSDTHVGLVFAYLDTARFAKAEALLREIEQATPAYLRLTPVAGRANADYTWVQHLRALSLLYADQVEPARQQFDLLADHAPLHAGSRIGQAQVAQRRERPEHAIALYEALATDHPDNVDARAGHATALESAGYHREARERMTALVEEAPEDIAVRNARRFVQARRAAQLDISAGMAREGGALANRESQIDARLSSPLLDDRWRVFTRQVFSQARVDDERVRLARTGVGVSWAQGRWETTAEAHHANTGSRRQELALTGAYRASDAWRLSASLDTNSLQTPWRARQAGVSGRDAAFSALWLADDARSVETRYDRLDLSDGNHRQSVSVDWTERWYAGPRVKWSTTTSLSAGGFSRQDVPYFSPERERAARLGARAEFLTWKRDDRRFIQALEVGTGVYHQGGYGSAALWEARYVHEWWIGDRFALRYGVGTGSQPYDGVRERRHDVFLNLSMPLP